MVISTGGCHLEFLDVAVSSGLVCRRQEKTESLSILGGIRVQSKEAPELR